MLVKLETILDSNFAAGSFNIVDLDMALSIIEGAEELDVPVIIGIATRHWKAANGPIISASLLKAMERASVPAVLHLDHGSPAETDIIQEALDCGFTSVMIDGSRLSFSDNVAITKSVVNIARSFHASVEGEIGAITGIEGVTDGKHDESENQYTDIDEAVKFVEETGVTALAVSIGTAHGLYTKTPEIQFDLISSLHKAVPVPLVMHGATGLTDEVMRKTIQCGIRKINYFSGLVVEAVKATENYLGKADKKDYLSMRKALKAMWKNHAVEQMRIFSLK